MNSENDTSSQPEDPEDLQQRILAGVLITIGTFIGAAMGAQSPTNRGQYLFFGAILGGTFGALLAYPSGRRFLRGAVNVIGVILLAVLVVATLRISAFDKHRCILGAWSW